MTMRLMMMVTRGYEFDESCVCARGSERGIGEEEEGGRGGEFHTRNVHRYCIHTMDGTCMRSIQTYIYQETKNVLIVCAKEIQRHMTASSSVCMYSKENSHYSLSRHMRAPNSSITNQYKNNDCVRSLAFSLFVLYEAILRLKRSRNNRRCSSSHHVTVAPC